MTLSVLSIYFAETNLLRLGLEIKNVRRSA